MTAEAVFFYALAFALVASALAMVLARNVIHAVLFMIANFVGTTILYLALHAPFVAAVQLIVYAGAIMVLFLFVVMLLGARDLSLREPLAGQRLWGVALAAALGMLLVFVVAEGVPMTPPGGPPAPADLPGVAPAVAPHDSSAAAAPAPQSPAGDAPAPSLPAGDETAAAGTFGSPQMIGAVLYTDYLLPFELVSVLLLVAMLGAVVIARFRRDEIVGRAAAEVVGAAAEDAPASAGGAP